MFVHIEKCHSNCQRIKAIAMHFAANNSFTSGISHTTPMHLFFNVCICYCSRKKIKKFYAVINVWYINKKRIIVAITSFCLVIRMGLEPMTPTLKVLCSTSWASGSPLYFVKASAKVIRFLIIPIIYGFYWMNR